MKRRIAVLFLSAGPLLLADVTLRYDTDFHMALPVPAGPIMPKATSAIVRLKGDKMYSSDGRVATIRDLVTNQTVMIDAEHMRYASGSQEDYVKALTAAIMAPVQNLPPQALAGAGQLFSAKVQSRKTGRRETIQGMAAEETEIVLSLELNVPLPNAPAGGPFMQMIVHLWTANEDDVARTPGLAELARYGAGMAGPGGASGNIVDSMRNILAATGLGSMFDQLTDAMKQLGMLLRTRMEAFSPMMAALPGFAGDPGAPVFSVSNDLVELSTEPVGDAVFQVPGGYRQAGFDEIVKDWLAAATGRKTQ